MKKTELVELIRAVVKEEINASLPQFLMEVLAEKIVNQEVITEKRAVAPAPRSPSAKPEPSPRQQPRPATPMRTFSTNPVLNQILNETSVGIPPDQSVSVAGMEAPLSQVGTSALDIVKNIPKEQLNENAAVAAVANALTKDYSALLKAIDSKAKSSRP
jgi:hypothetical protein